MKNFFVLVREPDGRKETHGENEIIIHRNKMTEWFQEQILAGYVISGSALSLQGKQIKGQDAIVIDAIHQNGTEIVGGYILLRAGDIDEAVAVMRSFPVYEFDGYVEIRELMTT